MDPEKGEYKLVPLQVRFDLETWENRINKVAAEGFEWVDSFSDKEGAVFAVMRRDRVGDDRKSVLADDDQEPLLNVGVTEGELA